MTQEKLHVGDLLCIPPDAFYSSRLIGIVYKEDSYKYYVYWMISDNTIEEEKYEKSSYYDLTSLRKWKENVNSPH